MKKFTLFLALCSLTLGFSQTRENGTLEVVPTIGTTLSGTSLITSDRSSIRVAIIGDYYLSDRWSLRSGLELLGMSDSGLLFLQRDIQLNYVNIPLHANWHFGKARNWNLNFGISPGFLTNAEENGVDVSNNIESFQLGFSYGIGYKLDLSERFGLLFDTQAFAGLTNYRTDPGSEEQNLAVSLSVGAVFRL
jgi:hypothetical protein